MHERFEVALEYVVQKCYVREGWMVHTYYMEFDIPQKFFCLQMRYSNTWITISNLLKFNESILSTLNEALVRQIEWTISAGCE